MTSLPHVDSAAPVRRPGRSARSGAPVPNPRAARTRFRRSARCVAGAVGLLLLARWTPAEAGAFPYDLDASREAALVSAGAALGLLGVFADRALDPLNPATLDALDPADVPGFDRGAIGNWSPAASSWSDGLLVASVLAPFALCATDRGRDDPWVSAAMIGETFLLTNASVLVLKGAFARNRPFVYNRDPRPPDEETLTRDARRSFPSRHTANTFAMAVLAARVNERLHPGGAANAWVWGGGLTLATTTAYLRVRAGKHFPSDVLAGAALGAAVGWLVPELHEFDGEGSDRGVDPLITVRVTF